MLRKSDCILGRDRTNACLDSLVTYLQHLIRNGYTFMGINPVEVVCLLSEKALLSSRDILYIMSVI